MEEAETVDALVMSSLVLQLLAHRQEF
jgi:hypothetical protein